MAGLVFAGLVRRGRKAVGSAWRLLNPGRQALLVLAYLRMDETVAEISAGFGVSVATAWRYVTETVMHSHRPGAGGPAVEGSLRSVEGTHAW